LFGRPVGKEQVLDHLSGHRGSRPVRIGNAAAKQLQLDLHGEVIDAASMLIRAGAKVDRDTAALLCSLAKYAARNWMRPDEGIWEPRWGRARNTHSRLLCWTALDRVIDLHQKGLLPRRPSDELAVQRDAIRAEILRSAWNDELESYVARVEEPVLDATLFLLPWYGLEDATSARMQSTARRLEAELGVGGGLYYRNRDHRIAGEGAFGICCFWAAEFLALGGGSLSAAERAFDRLCSHANDVGLFAEQIDPTTSEPLGNFPQAFTHIGLINTALTLSRRLEREAPRLGRKVEDELERLAPLGLR
jgi:GH15 family glucan-1,4-alpha-glucosidase